MKYFVNAVLFAALVLSGCLKKQETPSKPPADLTKEEAPVAGIFWSYPSNWNRSHDMPMRVATYVVPSGLEDVDPGECGVFHFGRDQGGSVDANIQRWGAQFEGASEAIKNTTIVNGMEVTFARISGTYLSPAGPEMQSQGKKPGYKLLGAIVNAPGGMIFFKFTAPASIIERDEQKFVAMLGSIEKE